MIKYKINVLQALKAAGYNTTRIKREKILSDTTVQNLRHEKNIGMDSLDTICWILNAQPGDIIEYVSDPDREEKKPLEYTYYSVARPVSISTYPKSGMTGFQNYDRKTYIEKIDRDAWGILHYKRPLTEKEKSDYELVPDPENP